MLADGIATARDAGDDAARPAAKLPGDQPVDARTMVDVLQSIFR